MQVYSIYSSENKCTSDDHDWVNPVKAHCANAYETAGLLSGVAQSCALCGAVLWALIITSKDVDNEHDNINSIQYNQNNFQKQWGKLRLTPSIAFIVAALLATIGYLSLSLIDIDKKASTYFSLAVIGFSEIGKKIQISYILFLTFTNILSGLIITSLSLASRQVNFLYNCTLYKNIIYCYKST